MHNQKSRTKDCGLTLVEIIISMVILAIIIGGIANLFLATKRHTLHSSFRMTAAGLGRYFLERLNLDVNQETWDNAPPSNLLTVPIAPIKGYKSTNNPYPSKYPNTDYSTVIDPLGFEERLLDESNITYYPVYVVEPRDGVRKVKLLINWTELSP